MKHNTYTILLIYFMLITNMFSQQDPMFTKYMFISDMMVNPASTGRGDKTKTAIFYRNQWNGVQGAPTTAGLSYEMPLSDGSAGIGLNLYQDKIGFETHSGLYVNYAYRLQLQKGITFSLGIKGGMSFYQANLTNAVTPEPQNFDPIFASNTKAAVPKTGAGIFLTSSRTYFGFSVPVLTALIPNSNFVFADDNVYLSHHFYATGGHIFDIPGTDLQLKPSIFLKYHKAAPLQLDLCAQLWYKDLFSFGLSYRTGDAIAAITDIAISKQFVLSYAYDYTNSEFRNIGQGAHEFILTYLWAKKNVKVPSIHKFSTLPRF